MVDAAAPPRLRSVADCAPEPDYPVEIDYVDLAPYRRGNTGVEYVHRFDSGVPGPQLMVNALTHGNEWCGMHVLRRLLDASVRPRAGSLVLSFANVAAYEQRDAMGASARFVTRDFNRLWHDRLLAEDTQSVEAQRAHAMRPIVAASDRLLDLHSTWHALLPFFVLPQLPRTRALADALALPPRQLLLPLGDWHEGFHLIDYGRFRDPAADAIGLIAECGQHFARSSVDAAWRTTIRFLWHCGALHAVQARELCPELDFAPAGFASGSSDRPGAFVAPPVERFEIVQPVIARSRDVRLTCSYAGFERYAKGELAAVDGGEPVYAPFDGAILLAPRPRPEAGQQVYSWGKVVE